MRKRYTKAKVSEHQGPVISVRAFITNQEGKILVLKRSRSNYGSGSWCLPGGKVDYGDSPEQPDGVLCDDPAQADAWVLVEALDSEVRYIRRADIPTDSEKPGKVHSGNQNQQAASGRATTGN